MITTKFRFIWPSGFREEDILKSANQKQESSVAAMFVNGWDKMCIIYRRLSKDASYQVSVHLAKGFQRRRFKCEKLTTTDHKWWQKLTLPLARWAKNQQSHHFGSFTVAISTSLTLRNICFRDDYIYFPFVLGINCPPFLFHD